MVKVVPIYIVIFLLIAVLVFKCDNKPNESVRTIKSVVEFHDTIIQYVDVHHESIQLDTVISLDTLIQIEYQEYGYALNEHHYKINDSLLTGTIIAKSPFKPEIDFNYTLKNYTIKDSTVVTKQDLRGFYYGGEIVVHPLLSQMFTGIGYMNKKGDLFDVSVGRDFQNESNLIKLGYKKRF